MENKYLYRYFLATVAYGSVRKLCHLWKAETSEYSSYDEPNKPMPLGDKVGVFAGSLFVAPYIAPVWIMKDLNYMDVRLSGRDPKEFFKNKSRYISAFDYIFM